MSEQINSNQPPLLGLKETVHVLNHDARWRILRELAKGEALPTTELARRIGMTFSATYRHMCLLRKRGVVVTGYGGLYSLTPAYRPVPGTATIDFGHCVMRLDTPVS